MSYTLLPRGIAQRTVKYSLSPRYISSSTARKMSKPAPGHKDATYHTECTGQALETVKAHSTPSELTLFGACFCPFVHRVWIALEYLEGK